MIKPDCAARGRRVNKTPFTDIDSSMRRNIVLRKHNHVARANAVNLDWMTPILKCPHSSRGNEFSTGLEHVTNQATAIKAALGGVATIAVGRAHQVHGVQRHVLRLAGAELAGHFG